MDMLYADLFAQRLYYQDIYDEETDIIKKLKLYLFNRHSNINDINNILFGFYQYYNIENITLELIQENTVRILPIFNIPINEENNNDNNINYINIINRLIRHRLNNNNNNQDNNNQDNDNQDNDNQDNDNQDNDNNNGNNNEGNNNNEENNFRHIFTNSVINLLSNFNIIDIYIDNQNNQQLEDVIVTVNDEDLEKMEEIIVLEDTNIECTICLNNIVKDDKMIKLSCNHSYHSDCIMTYLKNYNHKCPICRCEIGTAKYNINNY